ncbi:hypothetical protein SteCoe_5607 [Stentor coeruleus]|uniref:RING-type domain-containing protein n=1 Tax=Stentor coeruleus TaxID=5963 RepID=A0A1R2CS65_9CILI|nr:hypothetical protein SteCoe_5607 [Stentor coeruleus]
MEPEGSISDSKPALKAKSFLPLAKPISNLIAKPNENAKVIPVIPIKVEKALNPIPMKNLHGNVEIPQGNTKPVLAEFKISPSDPIRTSANMTSNSIKPNYEVLEQKKKDSLSKSGVLEPKPNENPIPITKQDDLSQNEDKSKRLSNESLLFTTKSHSQVIIENPPIQKPQPQTEEFMQVLNTLIQYVNCSEQTQENIDTLTKILKNIYSVLPKDGQLSNLNKDFCKSCGNKKNKILLDCSHWVCLYCLKKQCMGYIENPSYDTFKKFACLKCKLSLCPLDIQNIYADLPELEILKNMKPDYKCNKCKNSYTWHNGYCSELSCKDLCNNCYFHELFFKGNECPIETCHISFKKSALTNKRLSKCDKCKTIGNSVFDCYRNICSNHYLCYKCLNETGQHRSCIACDSKNITLKQKKLLVSMINPLCKFCNTNKILNDFDISKKCCGIPVCSGCQHDKTCRGCNSFLRNDFS